MPGILYTTNPLFPPAYQSNSSEAPKKWFVSSGDADPDPLFCGYTDPDLGLLYDPKISAYPGSRGSYTPFFIHSQIWFVSTIVADPDPIFWGNTYPDSEH